MEDVPLFLKETELLQQRRLPIFALIFFIAMLAISTVIVLRAKAISPASKSSSKSSSKSVGASAKATAAPPSKKPQQKPALLQKPVLLSGTISQSTDAEETSTENIKGNAKQPPPPRTAQTSEQASSSANKQSLANKTAKPEVLKESQFKKTAKQLKEAKGKLRKLSSKAVADDSDDEDFIFSLQDSHNRKLHDDMLHQLAIITKKLMAKEKKAAGEKVLNSTENPKNSTIITLEDQIEFEQGEWTTIRGSKKSKKGTFEDATVIFEDKNSSIENSSYAFVLPAANEGRTKNSSLIPKIKEKPLIMEIEEFTTAKPVVKEWEKTTTRSKEKLSTKDRSQFSMKEEEIPYGETIVDYSTTNVSERLDGGRYARKRKL